MRTNARLLSLVLILLAFAAYTATIVIGHGYFGFLYLAMEQPWGGQVFLDLVIALSLFLVWMVPDARARSLPIVPYIVATCALGSIGALAYLVHREVAGATRTSSAPTSEV